MGSFLSSASSCTSLVEAELVNLVGPPTPPPRPPIPPVVAGELFVEKLGESVEAKPPPLKLVGVAGAVGGLDEGVMGVVAPPVVVVVPVAGFLRRDLLA